MATENSPSLVQSLHSEENSNTTPERKKNSVILLYFVVDVGDKTKAICQSCKAGKVSRGGTNYKTFNTSNLRKHLQGHPAIFEEFLEKEKEKKLQLQSSRKTGSHKQVTLEALAKYRYRPC